MSDARRPVDEARCKPFEVTLGSTFTTGYRSDIDIDFDTINARQVRNTLYFRKVLEVLEVLPWRKPPSLKTMTTS